MFESLLLLLHVVVAVFLIILVLLQRSEGGMGSMGGGSASLMSSSGASNTMTKATAILATIFMVSSIFLAMESAGKSQNVSVTDTVKVEDTTATPMVPDVPAN